MRSSRKETARQLVRREAERTAADIVTIVGSIVVVFFILYLIGSFVFATFFAH